jgi:hypothetical protein
MKSDFLKVSIFSLGLATFLALGADRAAAQGPAGAGASGATGQKQEQEQTSNSSHHSLNPIKWVKKGSKNSADTKVNRADLEQKLTPKLQAQGVLPAKASATDACAPFTALNECLAALHASHNLGLDFACLRAGVTGVHTNVDVSTCNAADGEKALSLSKAIRALNPDADAKAAAKAAEQQAQDDLKDLGS